ncbi:MAG: TIGR03620 family F420-dependent LLM class oxidoreductase [Halioglobus sp.]
MKKKLGKLGVWAFIDGMTANESVAFAQQVEAWGYSALWIPEAVGRDPFSFIAHMAAHTDKLIFATGIANIYARDPMSMNAIHRTVSELAPGRFMLGMGVSHAPLVSDIRGHAYDKPVTRMRNYLEAMEGALYLGPNAEEPGPILLGALRENMLKLSASKASGAHPYFVPTEHTAWARKILGEEPLLCPEQMLLGESDPDKARAIARTHTKTYTELPNYRNNLLQFGFTEADFENGGSDKLIDAIVAWGDESAMIERVEAHWSAGADHVCIQPLPTVENGGPDMAILEKLAPLNAQ